MATSAALAFDIITKDGHAYRQCAIEKVEPDALRIAHADGVSRIPYENLPADLQARYFEPDKVAAFRQAAGAAAKVAAQRADEERRKSEQAVIAAATAAANREQAARAATEKKAADEKGRAAWEEWQERFGLGGYLLLLAAGALALYFLPSAVARGKENAGLIFLLNLFTGWSLIGWIAAFIWAATSPRVERS
jgi:hypothetical protein